MVKEVEVETEVVVIQYRRNRPSRPAFSSFIAAKLDWCGCSDIISSFKFSVSSELMVLFLLLPAHNPAAAAPVVI